MGSVDGLVEDVGDRPSMRHVELAREHDLRQVIQSRNRRRNRGITESGQSISAEINASADHGIGDNFRAVINNGAETGQRVFPVHKHIMGGRSMNRPPG